MKNIFGFGTDPFKNRISAEGESFAKKLLMKLADKFPLIKEPLGIKSTRNNLKNLTEKVAPMGTDALLELAIKACEPYLLPVDATLSFSDSERTDMPDDISVAWVPNERKFIFHPKRYFYLSVKMWLTMSALYSESMKNREGTAGDILMPFNLPEKSCEAIKEYIGNKAEPGKKSVRTERVRTLLYNENFIDSYYDLVVVNGLLSKEYKTNNTIDTKDNRRDVLKYKNRLPKRAIPSFKLDEDSPLSVIDYNSQRLDFKLITQYLIERVTGANLAHYPYTIKVFGKAFHHYKVIEDRFDSFLEVLADNYPLPFIRLKFIETLEGNRNDPSPEDFIEDRQRLASDLEYQSENYFPLVDLLFHVLLKLRYNNNPVYNVLAENLNDLFETDGVFQINNRRYASQDLHVRVKKKDMRIVLSDGSDFPVTYKKLAGGRSFRQYFINAIMVYNNNKPGFASCIKDAFGYDYDNVKTIPEPVFADFVRAVFDRRKGFVEMPDQSLIDDAMEREKKLAKRPDKDLTDFCDLIRAGSFEADYITCRDSVFADYKEIADSIEIDKFMSFISIVVNNFKKYSNDYLFRYDNDKGFIPLYWIWRDKKFFGMNFEDLKEKLTNSSREALQLYIDISLIQKLSPDIAKGYAVKCNNLLKDAKSQLLMYNQFVATIISHLNEVITDSNFKKDSKIVNKEKLKNRLGDIKKRGRKTIKEGSHSYKYKIERIIDTYDYLPKTELKEEKATNLKNYKYHEELTKNDEKILQEYTNFFNDTAEFFYDEEVIEGLGYHDAFVDLDSNKFDDVLNVGKIIDSLKVYNDNFISSCIELLDFDIRNLEKGEQAFLKEIFKLFRIQGSEMNKTKEELLFEKTTLFQEYNSYDLLQFLEAVAYYSYINSEVLYSFINHKSVITDELDVSHP